MSELEAELGIHEFEIARRLRYRELAPSLAEVVDRLGAAPDGALAARARLMRDREAVTLHVLTVTDESGAVLHTSLHPNQDAAETARDELGADYPLALWTITPALSATALSAGHSTPDRSVTAILPRTGLSRSSRCRTWVRRPPSRRSRIQHPAAAPRTFSLDGCRWPQIRHGDIPGTACQRYPARSKATVSVRAQCLLGCYVRDWMMAASTLRGLMMVGFAVPWG